MRRESGVEVVQYKSLLFVVARRRQALLLDGRWGLDHSGALVAFRGETADGVGVLGLWGGEVLVRVLSGKLVVLGKGGGTYEKVLVGCLLVLLGHGGWWAPGEHADSGEEAEGDGNAGECVSEDLPSLSWGRNGTGTVGTEGNPVSYRAHNTSARGSYISPHVLTRPLLAGQEGLPSNNTTSAHPPEKGKRTSLLLLEGQLSPIGLHAVAQGHPHIGLLLRRHGLPPLLDVGERRVGDGVDGAGLDGAGDCGGARGGADGAGDGRAEHCGGGG